MDITAQDFPSTDTICTMSLAKIPGPQRAALQHIAGLLASLSRLEHEFRAAVMLFDAASPGNADLVPITLLYWKEIAARDGALTIYHFGSTINALMPNLKQCPALMQQIDQSMLRAACRNFSADFKGYEAIRHVVGHSADFSATIERREKHSIKGPWKGEHIELLGGGSKHQFSGDLYDRTLYTTLDGKVHSYEIADATAEKLKAVKSEIYRAFGDVITLTPTF